MVDPGPNEGDAFRVLVADDSSETRELLFEVLNSMECIVTCVKDGLEALAALQAEPFDLLITDYQMPRLDGLALLRCLQASTCCLPSILITGHHNPPAVIQEARQAGVTLVMTKPFAIPDLRSLVESIRTHRPAR